MQSVVLSLAVILSLLAGCSQPNQKPITPKTSFLVPDSMWGKSESDVKKSETLWSFAEKYGELSYSGLVKFGPTDSLSTLLTYYFQSHRLNRVQYYLHFTSVTDSSYVAMVHRVYSVLVDSLGKPATINVRWHNELYRNEPGMFAHALKLGHVAYDASWNCRLSTLKYNVWSDLNGEMTISLEYASKEYTNEFTPDQ